MHGSSVAYSRIVDQLVFDDEIAVYATLTYWICICYLYVGMKGTFQMSHLSQSDCDSFTDREAGPFLLDA